VRCLNAQVHVFKLLTASGNTPPAGNSLIEWGLLGIRMPYVRQPGRL